jgi:hypothetical protein
VAAAGSGSGSSPSGNVTATFNSSQAVPPSAGDGCANASLPVSPPAGFATACADVNLCYSSCGFDKEACTDAFLAALVGACGGDSACEAAAHTLTNATKSSDAFLDAQKTHCKCDGNGTASPAPWPFPAPSPSPSPLNCSSDVCVCRAVGGVVANVTQHVPPASGPGCGGVLAVNASALPSGWGLACDTLGTCLATCSANVSDCLAGFQAGLDAACIGASATDGDDCFAQAATMVNDTSASAPAAFEAAQTAHCACASAAPSSAPSPRAWQVPAAEVGRRRRRA